MLPDEIKPAMEGVVPSSIVTCSLAGSPNVTSISQIYHVDENHVALSHQFFNKTHRNIRENPYVFACLRDPATWQEWMLELQYDHSETEGPVFEEMDLKIEAIASMTGMEGVFKLLAADIYKVTSVRKSNSRSALLTP